MICDRSAFKRLLRSVFEDELRVDLSEKAVHVALPALTSSSHRQELAEFIFNECGAAGLKFRLSSYCALKESGRNSGLVLMSGETVTEVVPIINDVPLEAGIARWQADLSGRGVSRSLRHLLKDNTTSTADLDGNTGLEMMRELRIGYAYVARNFDEELQKLYHPLPGQRSLHITHTFEGGGQVTLGEERFKIGEAFFNPSIVGQSGPGLPQFILDSVNLAAKDDQEVRKTLLQSVTLAGGNSMMQCIEARLQDELTKLLPGEQVKVIPCPHRAHTSWIGTSLLSLEDTSPPMLRAEWQETGKAPECIT